MAKRKPGPGRPSKGARQLFSVRVPVTIAERVRADAEELDLSYSEHVANLLAEHYGLPPVALPPRDAEQMPLTA